MKPSFPKNIVRATVITIAVGIIPAVSFAQKNKRDSSAVASGKTRDAESFFTEGEKHFILENYTKALIYYQKSLEINPNNATVHYKIAEALAQSDKQEDKLKASISIERALALEKKNKYFYLLAAKLYSDLTQFDKAAQVYEIMFKQLPESQEHLYELAAIYQYAGQKEDAIRVYTRAETFSGINEISSLQKTRLYFELSQTEDAIREGEKLIDAFPDEEQFIVAVAETVSQYGFKEKAIGYLEKFIAENKPASSAQMLLAGLYRDTNQEDKARQLLMASFNDPDLELNSKLIVLGTYNSELNQARIKKQPDANKEKFALELLTILRKHYPEQENVHVLGGDLYLTLDQKSDAQKEYLEAIRYGSTSFQVWQNLLYLDMQLEQYENAALHSEQAMEYHPNQAMVYYFNGLANIRRKQYREAAQSLEQAKKLAGTNTAMIGEINGLLGEAYNGLKQYEKSDLAYEDALAYNASNENVLNNYSFYLAVRRVNLDKAEKMSGQLLKNNPNNPAYLDTYAWVLFAREKYRDARKAIEKAITAGPATATYFEHYGDILYKLGDVDNAVKQWEKARNMLTTIPEVLNKKIANRTIYE
ncbi:MAG: tetratricopeptide repeat protein [Cyclobacteriaceae bacterium]|nr:tetratricopeptide repeat protein [Cyclobacteriaceae bacterium]